MAKYLTAEERKKIETLIELGVPRQVIVDITGRSYSVIKRLALGSYDRDNEKKRANRLKAKMNAQQTKTQNVEEKEADNTLDDLAHIVKNIDKQLRLICKELGVETQ